MKWLMGVLLALGGCNGLSDHYGEPFDAAICLDDAVFHVPSPPVPLGECVSLLDGYESEPVELDVDSPCFGAWGEWLEEVQLPGGERYLKSRSREALLAVDDSHGPQYGEIDGYAKWRLPTTDDDLMPYELQVFLEPDALATENAKYKLWAPRVGACYQTISQRVEAPLWVSLGVFWLAAPFSSLRVDNTTPEETTTRNVQFGKVRLVRAPLCGGVAQEVRVSDVSRCDGAACAQVVRAPDGSGHVLRVDRGAPGAYRVRLREVLSGRDVTLAALGEESPCVSGGLGQLPLLTAPLVPASHLVVDLYEGCDGASDQGPVVSLGEIFVARCGRICPGI